MSVGRTLQGLYNGCNKIQHKLLPPVVLLGLIILIVRWANTPPAGQVWTVEDDGLEFQHLDDEQIQRYIGAMEDSRSERCKHSVYTGLGGNKVSILLDFFDHEFYGLKMTLESILKHTPEDAYEEIIILDDGTGKDHVMAEASAYLGQDKFKKVKAYRSDESQGVSLSRFKASKMATGSILVFLSTRTAVNQGWIEPLVEEVKRDHRMVAVSHMDSLLSNYRYFKTQDNLINVFNWQMTTLFMETEMSDEDRMIKTPVMTGDVFAIKKNFLDSIGNYDEGFGKGGGSHLELSFRAWMCGGKINIIPCSRVAVKDALRTHEVTSEANFRRIMELWLGPKYQRTAYKVSNVNMDVSESEGQSLRSRQKYLEKQVGQCANFNTYLSGVANMVLLPPNDIRGFGKLRAESGYCLHSNALTDGRITLQHCKPHMYEPNMAFTLDLYGRIMHDAVCVHANADDHSVTLQKCDMAQKGQTWSKNILNQLQNTQVNTHCLMHDFSEDGLHFLALRECAEEKAFKWSFVKY